MKVLGTLLIIFETSPTSVDTIGQSHAKASLTIIGPVSEKEVTKSKSDAFNIKFICSLSYPLSSTSLQFGILEVTD